MQQASESAHSTLLKPSFFRRIPVRLFPSCSKEGTKLPLKILFISEKHSPYLLAHCHGRLLELLSLLRMNHLQYGLEALVLDEADRLIELGFKDDLRKI